MNSSELLLSEFASNTLIKEFIFDDLCYTPINESEIELADLIINLGDYIIVIQLKAREEKYRTFDKDKEEKWLLKKCKEAKAQIKTSIQLISSGNLPEFKNIHGQSVRINSDAVIVPLVIFMNASIDRYSHLLCKHSNEGIDVNCMSFDDFKEMCKILVTPYEIVLYLNYRKKFYMDVGEVDYYITDDEKSFSIIKPGLKETLANRFLYERYGDDTKLINDINVYKYVRFLDNIHEHMVLMSEKNADWEIVSFLGRLDRRELVIFVNQLEDTIDLAKKKTCDLVHSMRLENKYAVLFVSGGMIEIDDLIQSIPKLKDVSRILEIFVYWLNKEEYRIDFIHKSNSP